MTHIKKTPYDYCLDFFVYGLLILLTIAFLYPLYYVIMASVSEPVQLMAHRGVLVRPQGFTIEGYRAVLNNPNIIIGYRNTLIIVTVGTTLSMFFTCLSAYVLSRRNLMLMKPLTLLIVFTMYFSGGMIPSFLLVRHLGLLNTRWALMIPNLIATWNLIVMRTAFRQMPDSLEESAKIDGANDLIILFRIILPLSKAVLAVVTLFYAVARWNAWFNALIFIQDRNLFPLQLILREILLINAAMGGIVETPMEDGVFMLDEIIRYASIIVSTLPILCIYPFAQKHFTKGVMLGSIKE